MPFPSEPRNATICRLLRCTAAELRRLRTAFKAQLQSHRVNGRPQLGQLPAESDPDGSIREGLWSAVAADDAELGALLAGERYAAGSRPRQFEERVRGVKGKIWRDLTITARRSGKKRSAARGGRRAAMVASGAESEPDEHGVRASLPRTGLRRSAVRWKGRASGAASQRSTKGADGVNCPPSPVTSPEEPSEDGRSGAPTPAVSREATGQATRRCPSVLSSPGGVGEHAECITTIRQAIQRIQVLEDRVKTLEESQRHEEDLMEDRVMRRVLGMLKERDCTIERLRWYLEGDL